MARGDMARKALVFVAGHRRPAVAPLGARYTRRHPDGTPVRASSTRDTLEAALARRRSEAAEPDGTDETARDRRPAGDRAEPEAPRPTLPPRDTAPAAEGPAGAATDDPATVEAPDERAGLARASTAPPDPPPGPAAARSRARKA